MGRNTRLRLVFLPTLLSCSNRFLRALQQNRAQSRLLYLLIILHIFFINNTIIILFHHQHHLHQLHNHANHNLHKMEEGQHLDLYNILDIQWLKAQFIFLFVVQHLQTNHQESRLQLHHRYYAISRHKLSWFYFLFLFRS